MRTITPLVVIGFVIVLAIAAGACVAWDYCMHSSPTDGAAEFQRLVGGLGLGAEVDLSECPMCFDPRIAIECPDSFGPVPSGKELMCPRHTFSLLGLPSS